MNRQKFRILIVDDDQTIRGLLTEALTDEGYSVVNAANGVEGLNVLELAQPNLVLLDIQMPKMDGRTFVKTLQTKRVGIPVIVMTADYPVKSIAAELGTYGYLAKPFDLDHVIGQVQQLYAQWSETRRIAPARGSRGGFDQLKQTPMIQSRSR